MEGTCVVERPQPVWTVQIIRSDGGVTHTGLMTWAFAQQQKRRYTVGSLVGFGHRVISVSVVKAA